MVGKALEASSFMKTHWVSWFCSDFLSVGFILLIHLDLNRDKETREKEASWQETSKSSIRYLFPLTQYSVRVFTSHPQFLEGKKDLG